MFFIDSISPKGLGLSSLQKMLVPVSCVGDWVEANRFSEVVWQ
jgi:hypothetical protein